jgi:hypothetical protein
MNSFLSCLDDDFRYNLFKYNQYHIDKGNISPSLNLPQDLFNFENIHKNLGDSPC